MSSALSILDEIISFLGEEEKDLEIDDQPKIILLDGGMGYELFRLGLMDDRTTGAWSAPAITDPTNHDIVVQAHYNFMEAGAQCIITNNYMIVPKTLKKIDWNDDWASLIQDCVNLAIESRQRWYESIKNKNVRNKTVHICGSLPPLSESYRADLVPGEKESVKFYARLGQILSRKCDRLVAETMSSIKEASNVLKGVSSTCPSKPIWVSFTVKNDGTTRCGNTLNEAIELLIQYPQVDGLFLNCSPPEAVPVALGRVTSESRLKLSDAGISLGVYANGLAGNHESGTWTLQDAAPQGRREDLLDNDFVDFARECIDVHGCRVIGGCCGIYPRDIAAVNHFLQDRGM